MKENNLIEDCYKCRCNNFAKYRVVIPDSSLEVLEMNIKYWWAAQAHRHAFILTGKRSHRKLSFHLVKFISKTSILGFWRIRILFKPFSQDIQLYQTAWLISKSVTSCVLETLGRRIK